jgi:hypothetical protein
MRPSYGNRIGEYVLPAFLYIIEHSAYGDGQL